MGIPSDLISLASADSDVTITVRAAVLIDAYQALRAQAAISNTYEDHAGWQKSLDDLGHAIERKFDS